MYSKKEVVELFNEFKSDWCNDYQMADIDKFLKEKGLIEQFEVGKWYKYRNYLVLLKTIENGYARFDGFIDNRWCSGGIYVHIFKPATPKEVEEALIKEYKKRNKTFHIHRTSFINNVLYINGKEVFKDGKWAEIVEEKKELPTINWDLRNLDAIMINGETYIKK